MFGGHPCGTLWNMKFHRALELANPIELGGNGPRIDKT